MISPVPSTCRRPCASPPARVSRLRASCCPSHHCRSASRSRAAAPAARASGDGGQSRPPRCVLAARRTWWPRVARQTARHPSPMSCSGLCGGDDSESGDSFGTSVAISSRGVALIGAPAHSHAFPTATISATGAAYVFVPAPPALPPAPPSSPPPPPNTPPQPPAVPPITPPPAVDSLFVAVGITAAIISCGLVVLLLVTVVLAARTRRAGRPPPQVAPHMLHAPHAPAPARARITMADADDDASECGVATVEGGSAAGAGAMHGAGVGIGAGRIVRARPQSAMPAMQKALVSQLEAGATDAWEQWQKRRQLAGGAIATKVHAIGTCGRPSTAPPRAERSGSLAAARPTRRATTRHWRMRASERCRLQSAARQPQQSRAAVVRPVDRVAPLGGSRRPRWRRMQRWRGSATGTRRMG